jgi:hypothetical protein
MKHLFVLSIASGYGGAERNLELTPASQKPFPNASAWYLVD